MEPPFETLLWMILSLLLQEEEQKAPLSAWAFLAVMPFFFGEPLVTKKLEKQKPCGGLALSCSAHLWWVQQAMRMEVTCAPSCVPLLSPWGLAQLFPVGSNTWHVVNTITSACRARHTPFLSQSHAFSTSLAYPLTLGMVSLTAPNPFLFLQHQA